ncbi:MAG: hypothetical protein HZC54_00780 [Verrucomicrobia bacterium]|nr:hypothetical protein [Verrucomicrobiota bacterium]
MGRNITRQKHGAKKGRLCTCCRRRRRAMVIRLGHWFRSKLCAHCLAQRKISGNASCRKPKHGLPVSRRRVVRAASCGFHGVEAFNVTGPAERALAAMNRGSGW